MKCSLLGSCLLLANYLTFGLGLESYSSRFRTDNSYQATSSQYPHYFPYVAPNPNSKPQDPQHSEESYKPMGYTSEIVDYNFNGYNNPYPSAQYPGPNTYSETKGTYPSTNPDTKYDSYIQKTNYPYVPSNMNTDYPSPFQDVKPYTQGVDSGNLHIGNNPSYLDSQNSYTSAKTQAMNYNFIPYSKPQSTPHRPHPDGDSDILSTYNKPHPTPYAAQQTYPHSQNTNPDDDSDMSSIHKPKPRPTPYAAQQTYPRSQKTHPDDDSDMSSIHKPKPRPTPYAAQQTYPHSQKTNPDDDSDMSSIHKPKPRPTPYAAQQIYPHSQKTNPDDDSDMSSIHKPKPRPTPYAAQQTYPHSQKTHPDDDTYLPHTDNPIQKPSLFHSGPRPRPQTSHSFAKPDVSSEYNDNHNTDSKPTQFSNSQPNHYPGQQSGQRHSAYPNQYDESNDEDLTQSNPHGSNEYMEAGSADYNRVLQEYGYNQDPCKAGSKGYSIKGACNAYFTCEYQRGQLHGVKRQECDAGHRFDSKEGCVKDKYCETEKVAVPPPCPNHIKASSNPFAFYLGEVETLCAEGTIFDQHQCACVNYDTQASY